VYFTRKQELKVTAINNEGGSPPMTVYYEPDVYLGPMTLKRDRYEFKARGVGLPPGDTVRVESATGEFATATVTYK
jgi:hypothetical protein